MYKTLLSLLILAGMFVGTAGVTAARFMSGDRELLENLEFGDGLEHWEVSRPEGVSFVASDDQMVLRLVDSGVSGWTQVFRRFVPPEGVRYLWFEGWIRSQGVAPLAGYTLGGRLFLRGVNADGMDLDGWPYLLADRRGDNGWTHATGVFPVRAAFGSIRLGVSLVHAEGQVEVRGLHLRAARQVAWFPAALAVLIACWVGGIWYLVRTAAGPGVPRPPIAAATLLVMLGAAALVAPGERLRFLEVPPWGLIDMADRSSVAGENGTGAGPNTGRISSVATAPDPRVPETAGERGTPSPAPVETTTGEAIELMGQRLGLGTVFLHFAGFACLTGLVCWLVGSWRLIPTIVGLAFLSEGVQYLGVRLATAKDVADLGANLLGVLAGYWLWALVCRRRNEAGTR